MKKSKGFSIIELLIVLFIIASLTFIGLGFVMSSKNHVKFQQEVTDTLDDNYYYY